MALSGITILQKTRCLRVNHRQLRRVTLALLKRLGFAKAELFIHLVSDSQIRKLNRKIMRHDRATDVISIGQLEGPAPQSVKGYVPVLGDIVISLETTRRQAVIYGNPFFYELCFYVAHGILHILGWDDNTASSRGKMLARQEELLRGLLPLGTLANHRSEK